MRIQVSLLLDLLADGMTIKEVISEYPQLTKEDIHAAIAYGAEISLERYVQITFGNVFKNGIIKRRLI